MNAVNFRGLLLRLDHHGKRGAQWKSVRQHGRSQRFRAVTADLLADLQRGHPGYFRASESWQIWRCAFALSTNGTIACEQTGSGTFTNPTADTRAEASLYVMTWVDVKYTYQPLIPAFNFTRLGIRATLPTTTLHRQAVMRRLQ